MENSKKLKKAYMLGLGAASLTAQAIKETVSDLANNEEFNETEAKEMVKLLIENSNQQKKLWQKELESKLKEFKSNTMFVNKSEFNKLALRVSKLEKQKPKKK